METLSIAVNASVVLAVGALLSWMTKGLRTETRAQITGLRTEMGEQISGLRTEMGEQITVLRAEMNEQMTALRTEMGIIRSDLTHVALALGARPRQPGPEIQSG